MRSGEEIIRLLKPGDEAALEAFLVRYAASSMFLRSNLQHAGLEDRGEFYHATYAAAFSDTEIIAVAAHCWNGMIVLQAPVATERLAAAAVEQTGRVVSGIIGPLLQAQAVRQALRLETKPATHESAEDLFALNLGALVVPKPLMRGEIRCRRAESRDHALLTEWRIAYAQETFRRPVSPELGRASRVEVEMLAKEGDLFVLEADQPLASCSFNAKLQDMVQVGGVFTPLLSRGRGYAKAVVAGALLVARSEGVSDAILFTGKDNAPAQNAYRALGFKAIGDYALVLFEA